MNLTVLRPGTLLRHSTLRHSRCFLERESREKCSKKHLNQRIYLCDSKLHWHNRSKWAHTRCEHPRCVGRKVSLRPFLRAHVSALHLTSPAILWHIYMATKYWITRLDVRDVLSTSPREAATSRLAASRGDVDVWMIDRSQRDLIEMFTLSIMSWIYL